MNLAVKYWKTNMFKEKWKELEKQERREIELRNSPKEESF